MPVYNPLELLDLAIRSVLNQHYANWELCICDDASPNAEVRARLESWKKQDCRIKVTYSPKNEGIGGASNRALALATGEFVGLLDHDDEITPDALFEVVNLLQGHPDADIVYSDEDKLDPQGRRICPHFKPDWSPEQFLSGMYFCHFGVYRRRLLEEVGGFRLGFDGAQDYDLALRVIEKTDKVYHIPKILYHWRMAPDSLATSSDIKPYAHEAGRRALDEHLNRRKFRARPSMENGRPITEYGSSSTAMTKCRLSFLVVDLMGKPEALKACIRSVEERTSYRNYEIVVVGNRVLEPDTSSTFCQASQNNLRSGIFEHFAAD